MGEGARRTADGLRRGSRRRGTPSRAEQVRPPSRRRTGGAKRGEQGRHGMPRLGAKRDDLAAHSYQGRRPITAAPGIGLTKTNTPPSRPPESKNNAFGAHPSAIATRLQLIRPRLDAERLNASPTVGHQRHPPRRTATQHRMRAGHAGIHLLVLSWPNRPKHGFCAVLRAIGEEKSMNSGTGAAGFSAAADDPRSGGWDNEVLKESYPPPWMSCLSSSLLTSNP